MCSDGSGYIGVGGRELMEMGGEGNGRRRGGDGMGGIVIL